MTACHTGRQVALLIDTMRQLQRSLLTLLLATWALAACGGGSAAAGGGATPTPVPAAATRSWRLGFSPNPARPTAAAVINGIDQWSTRAEIAAIHEELPWRDLLSGMSPDAILDRDKVQLVNYLRGKGLQIYFMVDPTDGLSRSDESPQLRALGRSLAEPAVQQAYRSYVLAVERRLHPEYIGLAAETNLIRAAAPPALYAALVRVANDAAADLRAAGSQSTLLFSVQVEMAWGRLVAGGTYTGIERDFTDFPFASLLGLSSYPYFGFTQPEDVPANYYQRLLNGRTTPVMVVEGGWPSVAAGTVQSTPELQARYIARLGPLLDSVNARGLLQLVYADIDLSAFPPPLPANLPLFVNIGLTDSDLNAKPALGAWDRLYARRLVP